MIILKEKFPKSYFLDLAPRGEETDAENIDCPRFSINGDKNNNKVIK
jgi:hypothetical protein